MRADSERDVEVLVRKARAEDIPLMCGLLAALFSIEADFSPDRDKQARGLELLLGENHGSSVVLVAEKKREIVGMCSVQIVVSTAQGGSVGLVEDLVVREDCRGEGTGTRLLSEITGWCLARKISRLQLLRDVDNREARDFYSSKEWSDTNLVCMRKLL